MLEEQLFPAEFSLVYGLIDLLTRRGEQKEWDGSSFVLVDVKVLSCFMHIQCYCI